MFGLTEAFRSTYLDPDKLDAHPTSIGKSIPDCQVMVLDEKGEECPPNVVGELVHRGATVTKGYWRDPGEHGARSSAPIRGFRARRWCSAATRSIATRRATCISSPAATT